MRTELATLNAELVALQGETPLIGVCVDQQIVGEVISGWTGIPIGKMVKDEIEAVLNLEQHLGAVLSARIMRWRRSASGIRISQGKPRRSQQANRRVSAGRAQRCRKDRDSAGAR